VGGGYATYSRFINYGSNTIPFANNFQPLPPVEPPRPAPTPGTPISITITGIPAGYNNMEAGLFLFNTDMEEIASSWTPPALITAGNMSKNLYHLIVLPNGDWEQGEPFGTAGDYVIWVVILDDYYQFVYETSRFINYGSNTIPFANNFHPLPTDERPTVAPEPITITIDGLEAYNGWYGSVILSTALYDGMDGETFWVSYAVAISQEMVITNGYVSLALLYELPDGETEPFATAGDYYVLLQVNIDDEEEWVFFLYGTAQSRINYGTNPIPFASNFQPITLDW